MTQRLAEKKAQIGYTYEDSTVTETDKGSDKGDEDNSENSESEEDEVIPDIGVSQLLSPLALLFFPRMCLKTAVVGETISWIKNNDN